MKQNNKKKKTKNKERIGNIVVVSCITIIILVILGSFYYKSYIRYVNNYKTLQEKLVEKKYLEDESILEDFDLAYYSTKEGAKNLCKKNGLYDQGDIFISLSVDPKKKIKTPKKNIFGKMVKIACSEHTKKGRPKFDSNCIDCLELNYVYEKHQEQVRKVQEQKTKELREEKESEEKEKPQKKEKKQINKKDLKNAKLKVHSQIKEK